MRTRLRRTVRRMAVHLYEGIVLPPSLDRCTRLG